MIQTSKVLKRRLKLLRKIYLILVGCSKRLEQKKQIESKIPNATGLVTIAMLNTLSTEIENIIPDITNLAAKTARSKRVAEVESKIPDVINLATKAALNTKATD